MPLLILGLILWVGAHLFKRIAPAARDRMGNAGKGAVAVLLMVGLVLIIIGYRSEISSVSGIRPAGPRI